jgi:hypothetical protein
LIFRVLSSCRLRTRARPAGLTFGSWSGSGSFFCVNFGFWSGSVSGLKKVVGFCRFLEKVFVCVHFLVNKPYILCSLSYRKIVSAKLKRKASWTQKPKLKFEKTDGRLVFGIWKTDRFRSRFWFPAGLYFELIVKSPDSAIPCSLSDLDPAAAAPLFNHLSDSDAF